MERPDDTAIIEKKPETTPLKVGDVIDGMKVEAVINVFDLIGKFDQPSKQAA